jgi:8-oxo-dGTP pyrophosphatase MutT (NUDIX family)
VNEPGLYRAAVALVIAPDPDALLIIRRAHHEGDPWSGHMALPGGRAESGDTDLVATAIRETREEVGIEIARADLIGALNDVAPRTPVLPPIMVRPYVFVISSRPTLDLNPEVASAEWLELAVLRDPAIYRRVAVEAGGRKQQRDAFVTSQGVIWGMTERILSGLLQLIS